MGNPTLVELWRGRNRESSHCGSIVVADADGGIALAIGDVDRPIFPRSAVKALQALPLLESGAADKFELQPAEIALACASHSGEERHVETATGMLKKAGLSPDALECGAHWPSAERVARSLAAAGRMPTALHNNCSGKHSGFLCVCSAANSGTKGYVGANHHLQKEVRAALESVTGARHDVAEAGIDGCSIPTYPLPLRALALGFARFGSGRGLAPERAKAASRILDSIAAFPDMVAGEGRFDTRMIRLFGRKVMVKTGAEGVYCGTIPALGLGIALKCDDGGTRAAELMMAAIIDRFCDKTDAERQGLSGMLRPQYRNWNGLDVATLVPAGPLAWVN